MSEEENIVTANTYQEPDKERNIEAARADAAKAEVPVFDPVVVSSQIFETYFPIYCKQVDKLSKKQMRRICKAILGLPLEEGFKPNVKDKQEMDCYYVAERLNQAKLVLMHSVMMEKQRKHEAKQAEETAIATKTEGVDV